MAQIVFQFSKEYFRLYFSTKPGPSVERVALAGEAIAWSSWVRPLETDVVVVVVVVVVCLTHYVQQP